MLYVVVMMPAQLNQISDDDLCTSATEFAKLYEDDVSQDVVRQFLSLRSCFSQAKGITGPRDALQFIIENKLQSMPDVVTCYRPMLFFTLPVILWPGAM